jgi:DNA polymerase family A/TubC N-terminal docking domain
MSLVELMTDLSRLGVRLEATGGRLRYFPVSAVTPELIERMKACKGELLELTRAKAREQRTSEPVVSMPATIDRLERDPLSPLGESGTRLPEQVQVAADEQVVGHAALPNPGPQASDGPSEDFSKLIAFEFWDGQQLRSQRDQPIAIDVETEVIADKRIIPRLALASASDGVQNVVIHPNRLGDFLETHRKECFVSRKFQFDFWVIDEHLRRSGHAAQRVLWEACNDGRLRDSIILDMLIQLATGNYRKTGGAKLDAKVYPGNPGEVAADYTAIQISKDDPYHLRFGELIGLSPDGLRDVDPAFFQYAIRDVIATHILYPALSEVARSMMLQYGFSETATRFEIRPDAIERWGHLSEVIQVKASLVLPHMFRRGVHVNQAGAQEITERYRQSIGELTNELRQHYPGALAFDKRGGVTLTQKGKTPSLGGKKLTAMLERVAEEIREQGHPMEIPLSEGKKPGISQSVKAWQKYAPLHRFLEIWSEMTRLAKRLGFLRKLNAPVLHCKYSLLTRTGRTACSEPSGASLSGVNLQQIPRLPEIRGLFVARRPGNQLFIADYSAIELRTLGAVCRAKFGFSKLADVIEQGLDPHAFTAAAILGKTLDEFLDLKTTDPDCYFKRRQAAKAINFGVPGGLGAKALRVYAETNYGVRLTLGEAKAFRSKLISKVYPELNDRDGYLAETNMAPKGGDQVTLVVRAKRGSPKLHDQLYHQRAATLTGRIRDGVGFTESKNTPFQSLAADGAKLALWNLLYAGFDVYGFIHDEIIVNVPSNSAQQDALRIKKIMQHSMEEVLGGIPAACSCTLSDRWAKPD